MVELRRPTSAFLAVAKGWHEDEETNLLTGFGPGKSGILRAHKSLEKLVENCPPDHRLLAVWEGSNPVGYVVVESIDPDNRKANLHITLGPGWRGEGIGVEALKEAVLLCFKEGLFRLEFKPKVSNKRAIETAIKAGGKLEARTKYSAWGPEGPIDQAQIRFVKPEFKLELSENDD